VNSRRNCVVLLGLVLMCATARGQTTRQLKIPVVAGLTIVKAVHATEGDYEAMSFVDGITARGVAMTITGDAPQIAGQKPEPVTVLRVVGKQDLKTARTFKYVFNTSDEDFISGTTAVGVSSAVLEDVRARGQAQLTLDGRAGGLAGLVGDLLGSVGKSSGIAGGFAGRVQASGIIKLAEPRPVLLPVLVNGRRTMLSAWHLRGRLGEGDSAEDAELFILDDVENPLTLRFTIGADKLDVIKIEFPVTDAPKEMERELAENRRTAVYGIYFDFNSATIKPQSEPVLREIVSVMKSQPSWLLKVEGHTDDVGGDAKNLDLSSRRAAAVRAALVARGIPEGRLTTGGYGASQPRETNTTLAGRARNRRVELSRQ
jgi:outer membrane protein OmpA-like peptidoglycan-associated protein